MTASLRRPPHCWESVPDNFTWRSPQKVSAIRSPTRPRTVMSGVAIVLSNVVVIFRSSQMHVRRGEKVNGPHNAGQGEIGVEAHVIELVADYSMLADAQGENIVARFHRQSVMSASKGIAPPSCVGDELAVHSRLRHRYRRPRNRV